MKRVLLVAVAVIALAASGTTQAAPARTSCSDLAYLTAALKAGKKAALSLRYGSRGRWSAAVPPARTALALIKRSPEPCDDNGKDYWLHRRYSIHEYVALVRAMEEYRSGDFDQGGVYQNSMEFWQREITDIQLTW